MHVDIHTYACIYRDVCMYAQDSVQQHNRNYDIRYRHQHNLIVVMIIIVLKTAQQC